MRLVVDGHRGNDGIICRAFGDVHLDAVNGEAQAGLRLVVHRFDGERELSHVVADIFGGVVDGCGVDSRWRGRWLDRLLAGCKQHCEATQRDDKGFLHD